MKIIIFVLLSVFVPVFANGITSNVTEVHGTYEGYLDDYTILDFYPLGDDLHTQSFACYHDSGESYPWITADDFNISQSGTINQITYWSTVIIHPMFATIYLYDDAAPGPGTELQNTQATNTVTQTTVPWGSDFIYENEFALSTPFTFDQGTSYWVAPLPLASSHPWFLAVGLTVHGESCYLQMNNVWAPWTAQSQPPTDVFRVISGNWTSALDRTSWGSIKTLL